ncbi:hypothetical protein GUITHDRAFT_133795 [Guillardia theta CCMP2712]|uniref:Uncharacterized protein n=1 Tax=Guillardia theta (strain CCMP2712) TaxID=905079 RepID=L1JUP2_GUITC|nr:hypothetical protein GUITHDRAFT_133795 [Guillardia theta CCMP2712]EKX52044.1 hypothetical protein GUITHDRAFT_133795 [Guillardia theta CCMP2712]|eukprot:XP_005839024.1 hypothetical protein GUITHDRAFT_133795 [Guillardia theta CCMP2712]
MGEAEGTGTVKGGEGGEQGVEEKRDELVQVRTGGEVGSKEVENPPAIKKGPSAAAQLKLVQFSEGIVNKEVVLGNLWRDQNTRSKEVMTDVKVVIMVLPDLRSMSCRRMLLSAGILQNPRQAQVCMEDFSLDLSNVELYIDNSRNFRVYEALGMEKRKALKSTFNEKMDAFGYYLLRACFGNTSSWCSGLGFSHKNPFLGGVFLVGEGSKIKFRSPHSPGQSSSSLCEQCAKLRKRSAASSSKNVYVKPEDEIVGMVYVPV